MDIFDHQLEYYIKTPEGLYYDRKSARIVPNDIIRHVVAFSNANGGILAIGIEDDRTLTGFNKYHEKPNATVYQPEDYKNEILKECVPYPPVTYKKVPYGPEKNDYLFLICIDSSSNQVIMKKSTSEVFLRMQDQSQKLTHDQITQLEYDKGQRYFEDQII